jgi:hypothetical protein
MRRQRRHDLRSEHGWEPLGEQEEGNTFGQALRDAVKAATPKTSGRNIVRLGERDVLREQGHQRPAEAYETVETLPCGAVCTDRRRVR